MKTLLTVQTLIDAPIETVWNCWITPADIMHWNNPSDDWHTPLVQNDVVAGGIFLFRMEAKDGSAGFDFAGIYDKVIPHQLIESTTNDGRVSIIKFESQETHTLLMESFEPEEQTPIDVQKEFCQGVLETFKRYVEDKK